MKIAFYKGTRPGIQGWYNRITRWVDSGPYSHCELIFSDGMSASSSFIDGGVRIKYITYSSTNWDFIDISSENENEARQWFEQHDGQDYDLLGNLRFVLFFIKPSKNKWFCNEAVAEALGLLEPWRNGPNGFAALCKSKGIQNLIKQPLIQ